MLSIEIRVIVFDLRGGFCDEGGCGGGEGGGEVVREGREIAQGRDGGEEVGDFGEERVVCII